MDRIRRAVPHVLTSCRVALGAAALIAVVDGDLVRAATCVTLGALVDGLDGHLARGLRVQSPFGALFDYFSDYLCFVIAPWMMTRALIGGPPTIVQDGLLGLPLVTGAIRYARNGALVTAPAPASRYLPGLGTVFYAFIPVTLVFLDARVSVSATTMAVWLPLWVAAFAVLMIAPVRYPKLAQFAGASPAVLVLLALMPFVWTTFLAGAALVLGLLYAAAAPLSARGDRRLAPDLADAVRERIRR